MTGRELHLRERIDTLTDQRDQFRDRVAVLERRLERSRKRYYKMRDSRDLWRARAMSRSSR